MWIIFSWYINLKYSINTYELFIQYSLLQQSIDIYEFMFNIPKYNKGLSYFLLGYS